MSPRKKVARNEPEKEMNENHWEGNMLQALHRLTTQGREPKKKR